jgi:hypothetical protein
MSSNDIWLFALTDICKTSKTDLRANDRDSNLYQLPMGVEVPVFEKMLLV